MERPRPDRADLPPPAVVSARLRCVPVTLPDFLIVGGQRCGTTWLASMLDQHPEIAMGAPKELHYLERFVLTHDRSWYERHFPAAADAPPHVGDATPSYGNLGPAAVEAVDAVLPGVRVILIVRHPIERSWSHICKGYGPGPTRPVEFLRLRKGLIDHHRTTQRSRNDFVGMARTWRAGLGPDRVHVAWFDDLVEAPDRFLGDVGRFLGVGAHDYDVGKGNKYAAHLVDMPPEAAWHLQRSLRPMIEEQAAYFDRDLSDWADRYAQADEPPKQWVARYRKITALTAAERLLKTPLRARRERALARAIRDRLGGR